MAMSLPAPMAMPTSATVSAGASLMPSPIIAQRLPSRWMASTAFALSPGSTSASTRSMPSAPATAWAARRLSPVSMTVSIPISRSRATARRLVGLI